MGDGVCVCACVVMDLPVQLLTLGCGAHDSHCPPKDRQTRERPEDKEVTDITDTSSTGVCLGAFQQDRFFSLSLTDNEQKRVCSLFTCLSLWWINESVSSCALGCCT